MNLAVQHIRWELDELVRRYRGRDRERPRQLSNRDGTPDEEALYGAVTGAAEEPPALAVWSEFHEQASLLPEEEREVFDLLYYGGLTQEEAADHLLVSLKTVQRRWSRAQRNLSNALGGEMPI